jgi:hypothetical protein
MNMSVSLLESTMRQLYVLFLVSLAAMATYACGSATPTGGTPADQGEESETCPVVDPGPPAVCPEGCAWNGQECRKNSSIVMPDARPDGGRPPTK